VLAELLRLDTRLDMRHVSTYDRFDRHRGFTQASDPAVLVIDSPRGIHPDV
jgi:hypothetical protein